jgi:hypothetical protein
VARTRQLLLILCALLLTALAACGGDDRSSAGQTVKDFVRATSERDAGKLCGELASRAFLEQVTGATGNRARDACKRMIHQLKGLRIRLLRIKEVKVDGDKAVVTATIESQERAQDQVFRLTKEGGRFKLAGGPGG